MTVFPPDNRRVIKPFDIDFDRFPLPAVTAIDTTIFFSDGRNPEAGFGSGIVISPNYVLSAAHNFYPEDIRRNQDEIRVSNSRNQLRLNSREIRQC
jgi:V8-like Glu-specific endopeptidase